MGIVFEGGGLNQELNISPPYLHTDAETMRIEHAVSRRPKNDNDDLITRIMHSPSRYPDCTIIPWRTLAPCHLILDIFMKILFL